MKNPPQGLDPMQARRRLGRMTFDVLPLDLTSAELLDGLGVTSAELVGKSREICQALADVAAEAGFEAIIGPSAALPGQTTLAVFGSAITGRSRDLVDLGVRTPPAGPS